MDNLNTDKIKKLIAKLDDGKQVSKRDLRNTIGQDGWTSQNSVDIQ